MNLSPRGMFGGSPFKAVFSHSPGECTIPSRILARKSGTQFKARTLTWRGFLKNVTLNISKQELLPLRENKEDPTAFPSYQGQRLVCS